MYVLSIICWLVGVVIVLGSIGNWNSNKTKEPPNSGNQNFKKTLAAGILIMLVGYFVWPSDVNEKTPDQPNISQVGYDVNPNRDKAINVDTLSFIRLLVNSDAGGKIIDDTDINFIRTHILLKKLAKSYGKPVDSIAAWTYNAHNILHNNGVQESNLSILKSIKKIPYTDGVKYTELLALYLTLKTNQ